MKFVQFLTLAAVVSLLLSPAALADSDDQLLKDYETKLESSTGHRPTRFELEDMCDKLTTIIKANPKNADALRLRSVARVEINDRKGAIEDIAASLALAPKNAKALSQNAILKTFGDDPRAALKAYDDAIAAGADSAFIYTNRGSLYERVGEPDKAIDSFSKAIAKESGTASNLARALRAIAFSGTKQYDKSIADCDIALKTTLPGMLVNQLHKTRGMDLFFTNRYKEAMAEFDIAANTMPDGPAKGMVVYLRGACHDKLGEKEKATEDMQLSQKLGFRKPGAPPPDHVVAATADLDKAVAPLIAQVRKTIPEFKERFKKGLPDGYRPSITTKLRDGAIAEQVFVGVDSWQNNVVKGRLLSEVKLPHYKYGQIVEVPESQIIDWTIVDPKGNEEGNVIGKFIDKWISDKK